MTERNTIRALIADDEPLARELLRSMLEELPGIEVVGECANGREAVEKIRELSPDLLFLDIQMPELDGFGVLRATEGNGVPALIFVTAYDQYAIRAFEVHAVDYLLKPFDEERLARAVEHARERLRSSEDLTSKMLALLDQVRPPSRHIERIVIKEEGRAFFRPVGEIDWIEAEGKYTRVHIGTEEHVLREGISRLEQSLDPAKFLRISRSAIVNIDRIKELRPWFQGDYLVVLTSGKQLGSTRGYRDGLLALLGKG